MKQKIIAIDEAHLHKLIEEEIEVNGFECDLNHIDVSNVDDMTNLFHSFFLFNGNISKWDVSYVENMNAMFSDCRFNGDISKWDVSNVKDMSYMFKGCSFNGDVSRWDVSRVTCRVKKHNLNSIQI